MWGSALAIAAPSTAIVAAADVTSSLDPYTLIGSVLTPVIVVVLLITNRLHTHNEVQRLENDLAAARAANAQLQEALTERVIPALTRSTLVLENISPLLQTDVHLRRVGGGGGVE